MKLEFVKRDKDTCVTFVTLKEANPNIANALRRALMDSVPTMAIETVEFAQNTSVLYDEVLAHRLGLVPLLTDLKGYTPTEDCSCEGEGCNKCTVQLALSVKGPCMVYAKDLKSKDPKIKPVYPDMPLIRLLKGQEVQLIATAILGYSTRHAKFSPGLVWYTQQPRVTVKDNATAFKENKHKYPSQVIEGDKISKKKIEDLELYDAVDGIDPNLVIVEYDPTTYLFRIEPWGQLTAKDMLLKALEVMDGKLVAIGQGVTK